MIEYKIKKNKNKKKRLKQPNKNNFFLKIIYILGFFVGIKYINAYNFTKCAIYTVYIYMYIYALWYSLTLW